MTTHLGQLGVGIGWRREIAWFIERARHLGFVELMAEDYFDSSEFAPIDRLRARGVAVIPHGISLSLGSAEPPEPRRLESLARLAARVEAPLISEHIAFVRGGGKEAGHLLPLPRTWEAVEIVVENIRIAKSALPAPLALENIATLFEWPGAELDEATFITEVIERADVLLLLDVENIYANAQNHGFDAVGFFDRLPLHRIAYAHVAGGVCRDGLYHDTHRNPTPQPVLELLEELAARTSLPGVMLERDGEFPTDSQLTNELSAIDAAVARGHARRHGASSKSTAISGESNVVVR